MHQIAATHKAGVISRNKFLFKQAGQRIECRVEFTPTVGGQEDGAGTLSSANVFSLAERGFSANNLRKFKELLDKPYGIVFCADPTNSGKTTSLHSALAEINTPGTKIWTAEDPVEITRTVLKQEMGNLC